MTWSLKRISSVPLSLARVAECLMLLLLISIDAILVQSGAISITAQAYITLSILITVTTLAWFRFDGGMHPCFLFLLLLLLFQGGKLFSMLLGATESTFRIDLQTFTPFDVDPHSTAIALLILAMSAVLVYCPPLLTHVRQPFDPGVLARYAGWALLLFYATYPFHLYKNIKYLEYALEHGYIALYFDNGEHMKQVGILVRSLSQLCVTSFSLYFCWEQSKKKLLIAAIPFFLATIAELIMGLRGKSLLFFICFVFLYKLKFNQRFSFGKAVPTAILIAFLSVFIGNFREHQETADKAEDNALVLFLNSQGVSFQVTQLAVAYQDEFKPHRWSYLLYPLLGGFRHQSQFEQGERFSNDLSIFLNSQSFAAGYACGSSYLAEAYLLGGTPGIIVISILIGISLCALSKWLNNWQSPFAVLILISLIFIPRAELVDPIAASFKPLGAMAMLIACFATLAAIKRIWQGSVRTYAI